MAEKVYTFLSNPPKESLPDDNIRLPIEYEDFFIIREMGWDWWTFQNQPSEFIELVKAFIGAENKATVKRNKRANR